MINNRYITRFYWLLGVALLLLASCINDDGPLSLSPEVKVLQADGITRTTATIHGSVMVRGSGKADQVYFTFGKDGDASATKVETVGIEQCSAILTNLTPGTNYTYRLNVSNKRSTITSEEGHFTTIPYQKPYVSDAAILSQGPQSIICGYMITDNGGTNIIESGCYLRSDDGTTVRLLDDNTSVKPDGTHLLSIHSLTPFTQYTLSIFAVNDGGETVSKPLTFSTGNAIKLDEAGGLSRLFDEETRAFFALNGKTINLAGDLNGDDIFTLRNLIGDCSGAPEGWTINLADANIVSGGRSYAYSRFTENDIVGYGMFADCAVKSVILPDNTQRIEQNAFQNCTLLESITIPASVTSVTPSDNCPVLSSILVTKANSHYASIDGVLFNHDVTSLVWFPPRKSGDYSFPPSLQTIGAYAFRGYVPVGSADGVHGSVPDGSADGAYQHSFSIPEGISEIGQGAFSNSRIGQVVLPSTVRTIPTAAFQNCNSLTLVHLGSGTELISAYAFDGCPLSAIYLDATIPPVCMATAFSSYDATLSVPAASVTMYRNHKTWGKFNIKAR